MKFNNLLLPIFVISLFGCNSSNALDEKTNDDYHEYKAKFDKSLVSQFPKNLTSKINSTTANTSSKKNNVGLILYEYSLSSGHVDSIYKLSDMAKAIAHYRSADTCQLIVNRFETKSTAEKAAVPIEEDSIVERACFENLYPIPNFVDYNGANSTACGLDSTFDIFILEAKAGAYKKYETLKPFSQMPAKWKNGYSKGIAISKEKRTVIYWSIIW